MPLPILAAGSGLGAVITAALGALVVKVFEFFYKFLAYRIAKTLAIGTAAITLGAFLTFGMAQGVKAIIVGVRIVAPPFLAQVTYFLPSKINLFIAAIITIRTSHFIWQWSMKNLGRYTQQVF